jgi:hypothetical protein
MAALTALYVWGEMKVVSTITKGLRTLTASNGTSSPLVFLKRLANTKRQVFNTLEQQTPILLDQLEKTILTEEPIPTIHIPPPQGPVNLGHQIGGGDGFDFAKPLAERAVDAIRTDLSNELRDARFRILRVDDDIYKWIGAGAAQDADKDSGRTIRQAQRTMYNELLAHGVTGFTDKAGRDWSLSSYVEMAVRTESARGLRDAHMQVMQAAGVSLFIVPVQSHPCPRCFAWQGKVLSVEPDERADATIEEATIGGLWHPNCFPGFVPVSAPSGVRAADSRWYEGELVIIHTAGGNELSVTPNHPILTSEGWVSAGSLKKGDSVIRYSGDVERVHGMRPDNQHVETPISDVFESLWHSGCGTTMSMPVSPVDFHGDGFDSDVKVVFVDSLLRNGAKAASDKFVHHEKFLASGMGSTNLLGLSSCLEVGIFPMHSPDCIMGCCRSLGTLLSSERSFVPTSGSAVIRTQPPREHPCAHGGLTNSEALTDLPLAESGLSEPDGLVNAIDGRCLVGSMAQSRRLGRGPQDSSLPEAVLDPRWTDAKGGRELLTRLSGFISADEIIQINRRDFAGHVYNLQTNSAWYTANSIVVHNCEHHLSAYLPGYTKRPAQREWTDKDEEIWKATQRQRSLEVKVRKTKRLLEASSDPELSRQLRTDLRATQTRIRELTAEHKLLRRKQRERVNLGLHK